MTSIQKIYSIFSKAHVFLILVGILVGASVIFSHTAPVYAGPNDNVVGFAWSDMPDGSDEIMQGDGPHGRGAGWISLNSDGRRADGSASGYSSSIDYGITIDMGTGIVSGYGWSEHMGWIDFSGVSMDPATGELSGNAQVVSGGSPQSGGWDGLISMSGTYPGGNYGVSIDVNSTGTFALMSGYAWGDKVMGWIDFNYASVELVLEGCTDPDADNYDSNAVVDDNSCKYDSSALDFCPNVPGNQQESDLPYTHVYSDGTTVTYTALDQDTGNCVEDLEDVCQNEQVWPGTQTQKYFDDIIEPQGYVQTSNNTCVIEPASSEICGNGIDDDGDGDIDEGCVGPGSVTIPIFEEI